MFKKLNGLERILLLSVGFTLSLLMVRLIITGDFIYFFYPWNLILAIVPYLFSRRLKYIKAGVKGWLLVACWLLFFPNAPYLITNAWCC